MEVTKGNLFDGKYSELEVDDVRMDFPCYAHSIRNSMVLPHARISSCSQECW